MEKERKKNKDKPSNPVFMRVFRFVFIILYGHSNATLMLRNNVPAKIVQAIFGHSKVSTTLDLYSHVITDMQAPAVAVIEHLLQG